MKIGFIGAGKVGSAFGHYLKDQGLNVVGYSSRRAVSAVEAAEFTGTRAMGLEELVDSCDHLFITTQDHEIVNVWNQIKKTNLQDRKIFHMSGSQSSDIFDGIESCRAFGYSLHPLFPFTDKHSYSQLDQAVFTIEGKNTAVIQAFLKKSKINCFCVESADKGKYHAAAVFASNYVTVLAEIAKTLFVECGLPMLEAEKAIGSLLGGTLTNINGKGVEKSLTGPWVRGDAETIRKHLSSINNEDYNRIYRSLGRVAVTLSEENGNISKSKACEIVNILGGDFYEKNCSDI